MTPADKARALLADPILLGAALGYKDFKYGLQCAVGAIIDDAYGIGNHRLGIVGSPYALERREAGLCDGSNHNCKTEQGRYNSFH